MFVNLKYFETLFNSYSTIFGLKSLPLGVFLALITLFQPNSGFCGLIALLGCVSFLHVFNSSSNSAFISSALRNSLLIGLVIGDLFSLNFYILALLFVAVFLVIIIAAALENIFQSNNLPTLSLPFCLTALVIFILLPEIYKFSNLPKHFLVVNLISFLPNFIVQFFHALSSILCITNPFFGLLFFVAILFASPLNAVFLFIGFLIGDYSESFFRSPIEQLNLYSESYNYCLVFAMIAGVFMTPSKLSLFFATILTVITALLVTVANKILNPWFLPILSFPFILVTLLFLLALKTINSIKLNKFFFNSPEKNLENSNLLKNRHKFGEIGIFLPVAERWQIQQAFDDEITHRGFWKHALDFVAIDENGQIFKNKGLDFEDHFSFSKDIFSPIDGVITSCVASEKDNKIGEVETSRNWGNYIIIKSSYGFFVKLAHLKKDSIVVKIGEFVTAGQKIAQCGNSGYSQEPHLHLQVQCQAEVGAKTLPFHLINYISNKEIHFHRTPIKNEVIESISLNQSSLRVLNFRIGDKMLFKKNNGSIIEIISKVNEETGEFYLSDGLSKLHYFRIGSQFYFYNLKTKRHSALHDLFASAPRIPLTYGEELQFFDELPFAITKTRIEKVFSNILLIFGFHWSNDCAKYQINKQGLEISGTYNKVSTFFKIDPVLGIQEFACGNKRYSRI